MVIASDIVYDMKCLEPLFQTVSDLLKENKESFFLLVYTYRSTVVDRNICQVAERMGLEVVERFQTNSVDSPISYSSEIIYIVLFKRSNKNLS